MRKEKVWRRTLRTPDISRVTPYSPEESIERLKTFIKQEQLATYRLRVNKAQESETWEFELTQYKNFLDSKTFSGILMRWGPEGYTKIRGVIKNTLSLCSWIFLMICATILLLIWVSGIKINLTLLVAIGAFLLYSAVSLARENISLNWIFPQDRTGEELINKLRELFPRENGSVE